MDEEITAELAAVSRALAAVRMRIECLGEEELLEVLPAVESVYRHCYSVALSGLAVLEQTRFAAVEGYPSTARLLEHRLHMGRGEAKARAADAAAVGPRRAMTGEPLPPRLPHAAAALAEGRLGVMQLRVIAEILDQVPDRVAPTDRDAAEATLVEHARSYGPTTLNRLGHRILDALDPDGPPPDEEGQPEDPSVVNRLRREDCRRGGKLTGRFDPESWALLTTLLDSLNQPRPAVDGLPDPRTAGRRDADALVEAARRLLDAGTLPSGGGERPHLTVTVSLETLRDGLGRVQLDTGGSLDPATVRRLACDARIVPVVLGTNSEPLDVGRATYVVRQPMRRALVARDKACVFPGCGRPPASCHTHHLKPWASGGDTALHNLVLLCGEHHRLVHSSHWDIRMNRGHPEFFPPQWLAPDRKPLANPLRQ